MRRLLLEAQEQIAVLQRQVQQQGELMGESGRLLRTAQERIEELEREVHRQAAPFRRPESERKKEKGKPGRKKGHTGKFRPPPPPPTVTEEAEVPLDRCPKCNGPVEDLRAVEQIIEDIPPMVLRRLRLTTYQGRCPNCGPVRSTHPDQVSTATGAAGTHLGRHALGLVAFLNKDLKLTFRRCSRLLDEAFGLSVTPGGLSQIITRTAAKLKGHHDELVAVLRKSPAVHADETSWWLDGKSAWLWDFTNSTATLYVISNRSSKVVSETLGDDYKGVLISDCLSSYDPHPGRKSKCCAHHLKAIKQGLELAPDSAFLREIRGFFKAAIALHKLHDHISQAQYWQAVNHLQRHLDELLNPTYDHPAEQRIRNRLAKHRQHLLTFLIVPGVDPTNNLAERQLRPAVIARKLSCGNKTENGKTAFEVIASLAATCHQQGRSLIDFVAGCLSLGLPPPALFDPQAP
jgi:hypothetical protein